MAERQITISGITLGTPRDTRIKVRSEGTLARCLAHDTELAARWRTAQSGERDWSPGGGYRLMTLPVSQSMIFAPSPARAAARAAKCASSSWFVVTNRLPRTRISKAGRKDCIAFLTAFRHTVSLALGQAFAFTYGAERARFRRQQRHRPAPPGRPSCRTSPMIECEQIASVEFCLSARRVRSKFSAHPIRRVPAIELSAARAICVPSGRLRRRRRRMAH